MWKKASLKRGVFLSHKVGGGNTSTKKKKIFIHLGRKEKKGWRRRHPIAGEKRQGSDSCPP